MNPTNRSAPIRIFRTAIEAIVYCAGGYGYSHYSITESLPTGMLTRSGGKLQASGKAWIFRHK